MTSERSSFTYLVRNHHSYCFRMVIPKDLQATFAKKELRYSLKTGYLSVAKIRARLIAGNVQMLIRAIRKGDPRLKELTPELVNQLVEKYRRDALDDVHRPINPFNDDTESRDFYMTKKLESMEDFDIHLQAMQPLKKYYRFQLNTGKYDEVTETAENLLHDAGAEYEKDSPLFITLCHGLLKELLDNISMEIDVLTGKTVGDVKRTLVGTDFVSNHAEVQSAKGTSKLLSEVIPQFVSEQQVRWTAKTKNEVEASLALFLEVVGDVPIQTVDRVKVADYKAVLLKLPPNKNKSPKYKNKTITELMEMDIEKTLSVERVNKNLQRASALLDYAIRHGIYDGPNPATQMQVPKDKHDSLKRASFTSEELEKLFNSDQYLDDSFSRHYMFWTPILALFHGMRQNEVAGLFLEDIKQCDEGIWYFDLTEKGGKTDAAIRMVPIHPFVTDELRFLAYANKLKQDGETQLFPELKKGRDGFGKAISSLFNQRYKNRCGIVSIDGRLRDFHSFRTTFITHLRHNKVYLRMLKMVVGHSVHIDVTDNYTEPYPVKQLFEEVTSKVNFHNLLDLSHLKKSKFVARG